MARLPEAAAFYLRETVPDEAGDPLALAVWESGFDLVVQGQVTAAINPLLEPSEN